MLDFLLWLLLLPLRGLWWLVQFDPLLAAFAIVGVFFLFALFGNPKAVAAWRESSGRERLRKGLPRRKGLRETIQQAEAERAGRGVGRSKRRPPPSLGDGRGWKRHGGPGRRANHERPRNG